MKLTGFSEMNASDFKNLPINEQVNEVLSGGRELLERIYLFYIVKLYQYTDFHVEIWYHQTTNRIDKVLTVELDDVIHLYESQINISDLFR